MLENEAAPAWLDALRQRDVRLDEKTPGLCLAIVQELATSMRPARRSPIVRRAGICAPVSVCLLPEAKKAAHLSMHRSKDLLKVLSQVTYRR